MKKQEKVESVFCRDCKWSEFRKYNGVFYISCMNPANRKNTWFEPVCIKPPEELNADNNCAWYENKREAKE